MSKVACGPLPCATEYVPGSRRAAIVGAHRYLTSRLYSAEINGNSPHFSQHLLSFVWHRVESRVSRVLFLDLSLGRPCARSAYRLKLLLTSHLPRLQFKASSSPAFECLFVPAFGMRRR